MELQICLFSAFSLFLVSDMIQLLLTQNRKNAHLTINTGGNSERKFLLCNSLSTFSGVPYSDLSPCPQSWSGLLVDNTSVWYPTWSSFDFTSKAPNSAVVQKHSHQTVIHVQGASREGTEKKPQEGNIADTTLFKREELAVFTQSQTHSGAIVLLREREEKKITLN